MKKRNNIKILAIESSCDETAASIIEAENPKSEIRNPNGRPTPSALRPTIKSNIVSSQIDLHAKTGGVVPEVASRAHMEAILPVINEALITANSKFESRNSKQIQNQNVINSKQVSDFVLSASDLLQDVTHLAVTAGPGLIGSLLVGFNTAKALAYSLGIPIIPVNHIEGHIYSALVESNSNIESRNSKQIRNQNNVNSKQVSDFVLSASDFPLISLTVSGGHTSLTLMKDHGVYENIGSTLDDAAGEAFDKVAKLLDLGYPGGPVVSKLAQEYRGSKEEGVRSTDETPSPSRLTPSISFPRPILNDGTFNFSFSGLKTAVLTYVKKATDNGQQLTDNDKSQICAAFEDAVVDVLVTKTLRAAEKYQPKAVILAGGVAANKRLRKELAEALMILNDKLSNTVIASEAKQSASFVIPTLLEGSFYQKEIATPSTREMARNDNNSTIQQFNNIELLVPPIALCGDNAAMIGVAAYYHILKNDIKTWNEISVDSNLKL